MNAVAAPERRSTPWWVWVIMIALPCIMPLTFLWIAYFPPAGTTPTGIQGVDGAVFINCMRMFETGFYTPFANCHAPLGGHSSAYFAAPFFWMYGVLGAIGRCIHANEFLLLGVANGVGGFLYLLAAYFFLRTAFPRQANLAFLLFALAGGPGGLLYVVTWLLGLHDAPQFEPYFYRYALYQLFEGARPSPILAMPRLYYTVSMACCLGGIAYFLKGEQVGPVSPKPRPAGLRSGFRKCGYAFGEGEPTETQRRPYRIATAVLLFLGTLINLRYGPMAWGVVVLYLIVDANRTIRERTRAAIGTLAPIALAWAIGWWMLGRSPAFVESVTGQIRTHMWLSPFVSAMLFHLIIVPRQVFLGTRPLSRVPRIVSSAASGYLTTFAVLYVLYNAYYGNVWLCLDVTSAIRISDPSLLGALAGAMWSIVRHRGTTSAADVEKLRTGWVSMWLLCFLCIAISAFGQGWFLRLVPERVMIFLALPFAVLASKGLQEWRQTRPRLAVSLLSVMVVCGLCAIGVASACFQGPLEHRPGKGPYRYAHCEIMGNADADLMARIPDGVVLTPVTYGPSFGDVLAVRPNIGVVYGFGSVNLSNRDPAAAKDDSAAFFTEGCDDAIRKKLVEKWCVGFVYCPDSPPGAERVIGELRRTPWLEEVGASGKAVLFLVRRTV